MVEMSKCEMLDISGEGDITSTLISAYIKSFGEIYDMGKSFGSALRRLFSGNICKI